jgi:hypothetical protein
MTNERAAPRSRSLGWVLLALLLYVGLLAASAPASVLGWALAHATHKGVTLEGPSGGFWRGRASKLNTVAPWGRTHSFDRLHWELVGARLLTAELAFRVTIADSRLHGSAQIALQPNCVRASDVVFDLPASTLKDFRPELLASGLVGKLTFRSQNFSLDRGNYSGEATLAWRNAGSSLIGNLGGDYVAHISGSERRVEFRVETLAGSLQVDGKGEWSTEASLSFDGTVRSLAGDRSAHLDSLKQFGPELAGGIHRVSFATMFR